MGHTVVHLRPPFTGHRLNIADADHVALFSPAWKLVFSCMDLFCFVVIIKHLKRMLRKGLEAVKVNHLQT